MQDNQDNLIDYQLDIFGNWIPIPKLIKKEKLDKNYFIKYNNWLKKWSEKNVSKTIKKSN